MAAPARADVIQLGFILDRSGSIGQTDWNIIVNGLSQAVNNFIPVGASNTYEVSVVTFADNASINIQNVLVSDVAARTALATQIAGLTSVYSGGLTNYADAFSKMQTALAATRLATNLAYVNFATDGDPTTGGSGSVSNNQAGINARNALINTGGVDNISIEGISVSAASATNLQNNYCHPGPCDTTAPFNFAAQGFYIGVANAQGYANAIGNKIQVVTEVPEPATLALFGMGLLGLSMAMRRRA
jgi:uncharacterized protein YegL